MSVLNTIEEFENELDALVETNAEDAGLIDALIEELGLTLTPPSNTPRRKARSARHPVRHRKRPCIYVEVDLSRA